MMAFCAPYLREKERQRDCLTVIIKASTFLQWGLLMGMEHERIHLETSSVLIRQLPVDMVAKPEGWVYGPVKAGK